MTLTDRGAPPAPVAPPRTAPRTLRTLARRHRGLLVLLGVGAVLRLVVVAAYVPAFWYPDSVDYVSAARVHQPLVHRPYGYSAFLQVAHTVLSLQGTVVLQHVLGLASAALVYVLLQHRGVTRWVSVVAVAPLALDAYVLDAEHYVLAESLFLFLLAAAVVVLLWGERPGPLAAGTVGLLVGALALTRTVGSAVAGVVLLYLLVRVLRRSARPTALPAFLAALAVLVVPYTAWFAQYHGGTHAVTDYTGHFLYGRVSNFVECDRLEVPARLRPLCPVGSPASRPIGDYYVWDVASPANRLGPDGRPVFSDADLERFARLAITGQPLAYATLTLESTLHYAAPFHYRGKKDNCLGSWRFPSTTPTRTCAVVLAPVGLDQQPLHAGTRPHLAAGLRLYQDVVWTPGTLLGLCAVAGLVALVLPGSPRERLDPALLSALGVVLVAVPSATAAFDYRYLLPTLVVLPLGAALAAQRLRRR